jgi:hypothetical protein
VSEARNLATHPFTDPEPDFGQHSFYPPSCSASAPWFSGFAVANIFSHHLPVQYSSAPSNFLRWPARVNGPSTLCRRVRTSKASASGRMSSLVTWVPTSLAGCSLMMLGLTRSLVACAHARLSHGFRSTVSQNKPTFRSRTQSHENYRAVLQPDEQQFDFPGRNHAAQRCPQRSHH